MSTRFGEQTPFANETDSGRTVSSGALQRARRARLSAGVGHTDASADGQQIASDVLAALLRETQALRQEVAGLKDLAVAFERWHQDMISIMDQNRGMRRMGDDLATIVKQLIMLSLNAAIEAARAGESARGFVVVASEVRSLSLRAQALSKDLGKNLDRNDLTATATFQDIQAGGKLMLAAISGLESMVRQMSSRIEQV